MESRLGIGKWEMEIGDWGLGIGKWKWEMGNGDCQLEAINQLYSLLLAN
jgi:hypothetical protein